MISIEEHITGIINNYKLTIPRNPYHNLLFSTIEEECGIHFSPGDFVITSSAEHYAIFNHFKTFSNVLTVASGLAIAGQRSHIVVLADSIIPLDNADYPRGIAINTDTNNVNYFPLFSKKYRKWFPLSIQNKGIKPKLIDTSAFVLNQDKVLQDINSLINSCDSFFSVVSEANQYLYNKSLPFANKPQLHYLSLEKIATKMLLSLLRENDLFCKDFVLSNHDRTYKQLYGVRTCWGDKKGSFLFWHQDKGMLFPCLLNSGYIESERKKFPLSKESLIDALNAFELIPGGFISLSLVSILPNQPTIGGVPQSYFLQRMMDYVEHYSDLNIDKRINNYNWGIHPTIGNYSSEKTNDCSMVYLAANPLPVADIVCYYHSSYIKI